MGEKMNAAPIFLTIGQVRFNPILQMADSIKLLQDRFRKIGYADFSTDELKTVQVDTTGPTPQVNILPTTRWRFGNTRRTAEYTIFQDRLVFQNAAYETSDDFINSVLTGVSLVNEALQISYVESVGVRTLDAIIPAGEADLKRYLLPQLIGFFDVAPGALKHSILEGVSEYGQGGQLVSRVVIMRGALGMPIDLMPMMLAIDSRFTKIAGVHAVLDNDCAIPERFDWDDARVRKNLQAAKAGATKAFYQAVTKEALNEWK